MDGIPKSSQMPGVTYRQPLVEGAPGHGEGHNSGQAVNVTAALALQGPRARRILQTLTNDDMRGLRFFGVMDLDLAGIPVSVSRTGYTGDLGYEVWVDRQGALPVWDALTEAGREDLIGDGPDALVSAKQRGSRKRRPTGKEQGRRRPKGGYRPGRRGAPDHPDAAATSAGERRQQVSDKVIVIIGTAEPETATQESLASMMVGRDVVFEIDADTLAQLVINIVGLGLGAAAMGGATARRCSRSSIRASADSRSSTLSRISDADRIEVI